MTKQIKIVASREEKSCEALFINAASYQGSAPFGGAFQVWDLDNCCSTDPETGQMLVDVLCQWQDDPSEEPMMTLTVHDPHPVGCSGFDGDVVARLDYA